jgi:hypothetical protein
MENQRVKQFELFVWGAFAALSVANVDRLLDFEVSLWFKVAISSVIFSGWLIYLLGGERKKNIEPPSLSAQEQKEYRKKVLVLLVVGVIIGFIVIVVIN